MTEECPRAINSTLCLACLMQKQRQSLSRVTGACSRMPEHREDQCAHSRYGQGPWSMCYWGMYQVQSKDRNHNVIWWAQIIFYGRWASKNRWKRMLKNTLWEKETPQRRSKFGKSVPKTRIQTIVEKCRCSPMNSREVGWDSWSRNVQSLDRGRRAGKGRQGTCWAGRAPAGLKVDKSWLQNWQTDGEHQWVPSTHTHIPAQDV